ncbi:hypothetical protein [Ruegeria halocynthiae]|uniref:hypothetical protein n=1 Tax=Ruegeria halocynthiae TaxID=985054 RepID=UPI000B2695A7|nr:hypothetical protein [Ruegeria halocynthiae]
MLENTHETIVAQLKEIGYRADDFAPWDRRNFAKANGEDLLLKVALNRNARSQSQ